MKIALIDLEESALGCNNKDKSGGFGNAMKGRGLFAKVYGALKHKHVRLPIHHFGTMAAIFRQAGHEVTYGEKMPQENFDIAFLASSIVGYDEEIAFARELKKNFSGKVGFFGPFSTVRPELFLAAADFVLEGEPEGVSMKIARGELAPEGFIRNQLIHNLDEMPLPDWTGFPIQQYDYSPLLKKKPLLPVLTSRGCSFDCDYCPYMVMQTHSFRTHSIPRVLDELDLLIRRWNVRSVVFRDIIFTLNKKRIADLCDGILQRGYKLQWSCETRADCLDEGLLDKMRQAGLEAMHLGIESPADDVLARSGRKPITEIHQEKIIRHCEKLGVKVASFFIFGFFDDTMESMRETLDYAKHLNTSMAQFNVMTPFPGTRFYDQFRDRITTDDWKLFDSYTPVTKLDHLTPRQVMDFKDRAYSEYYLRWDWLAKNGWKVLFQ